MPMQACNCCQEASNSLTKIVTPNSSAWSKYWIGEFCKDILMTKCIFLYWLCHQQKHEINVTAYYSILIVKLSNHVQMKRSWQHRSKFSISDHMGCLWKKCMVDISIKRWHKINTHLHRSRSISKSIYAPYGVVQPKFEGKKLNWRR